MSLKEAYTLAHSAQCRLQMEANRPERNLRFVVGHLMHYENLRLRIVEIEHDISKSERASAVQFKGTGHVDQKLQQKPSTGQLGGRKSPPPPAYDPGDDDEGDDDDPWSGGDEDDEDDGLGLQRFPSGSARPPQHPPPELEPDVGDDDDDDEYEPESPEEPDQETLEKLLQTEGTAGLATMYEGVRKCPCHGKTDSPSFENMWELPPSEGGKEGVTRAVAQVFV